MAEQKTYLATCPGQDPARIEATSHREAHKKACKAFDVTGHGCLLVDVQEEKKEEGR